MDINRILPLARRIVTQCVRDRRTMGLIIIVPSLVMALLGYFYTTSTSSVITLGVVDQDLGMGPLKLSGFVVDELRLQPNVTVVLLGTEDPDQAIKDKKVDAAVIFGSGFTSGVLTGHQASMEVVSEGTDQMKTALAAKAVGTAAMSAVSKKTQTPNSNASAALMNIESRQVYASGYTTLDLFAPYMLGIIAFVFVFIFTGVTFLRERSFGTFERLLVSPLTRAETIVGYMLGFSVFAIIQSAIILAFAIFVLKVKIAGDIYAVVLLQLLLTVVGVNLGIFCSAFARNELQAVQFIPLLILPQVFLDGMLWPISTLPNYLQVLSYLMPLTYANNALQSIMVRGTGLGAVWTDIAVLLGFAIVMIALSALSLNKQLQQ
ncbi:MAG: ABC-2 family transporter protein [Methanocella sp. PtaU1.Bin125]|nr:MAG: ABC-2 family transporter protein [Methanocella sp. PtaU1.Bin125]